MKLRLLLCIVFIMVAGNARAALLSNAVLSFDPGVGTIDQSVPPISGSYFGMGVSSNTIIYTTISPYNGLMLGSAQPASGSHTGTPNGSERPNIDQPFSFFANTGMHETSAPVNILSDDNNGNVTLDFSGWGYDWNGIPFISLGVSPQFPTDTGVATLTCGSTCDIGDSFTLDYAAHVYDLPGNPASGLNAVPYTLRLEGTVSAVPVPAALWLFGSGLIGLIGIARRSDAVRFLQ